MSIQHPDGSVTSNYPSIEQIEQMQYPFNTDLNIGRRFDPKNFDFSGAFRYGYGGPESAVTPTNTATDPKGESLPASPEEKKPESPFGDLMSALLGRQYSVDDIIRLRDDDEARGVRDLNRLKELQDHQAAKMFDYGFKSNVLGSMLKDIPQAIGRAGSAYNDVMAGVLLNQQSTQPLLYAQNAYRQPRVDRQRIRID
jgi:hypothetical protein